MPQLTRFSPSGDVRTLQTQMQRLFEPFFGRLNDEDLMGGTWVPPVDVIEEKDAIVVSAELPGIRQEDVEIQYENGILTLRGSRTMETETAEKTFHRVERMYGTFARSFTLPRSVDPERIEATYHNGVLEVRVPKREEAKPKQIKIAVK